MRAAYEGWDGLRAQGASLVGGAIRVTLLFGSAAIALALFLAPLADRYTRPQFASGPEIGLDMTTTASIVAKAKTYTLRRSVLQASPHAVCIIGTDGGRSGDC